MSTSDHTAADAAYGAFLAEIQSPARPAYTTYVMTSSEGMIADYAVIGYGVMDRRAHETPIVDGLTEDQATKIAAYLNAVTGAMER